ncbi:MAG: histone H1 [Bacteroidetes bacterium]|nr:histone H1 [Bacteroidota bacterium]
MQKYETLKALVAGMETDTLKFYNGNNAAGTRVRKHLQDVKKACQDMRNEVQEIRATRKDA